MRKVFFFIIGIVAATGVWGQVKLPQVRVLESQGWTIQHSVMSWDSLSVYFSAKSPGANDYDLYILRAEGWRWSSPERLSSICTGEDELSPSISSDERMLFYVSQSKIWRAWYRDGQWREAAPIIVSAEGDDRPCMAEDNHTLLFMRRIEGKRHEVTMTPYQTLMMDDHNWTIPAPYSEEPQPDPILAVSGEVIMQKGLRPLTTGRILVYDALNEQLRQEACVHPVNGRWRVALQNNRRYRIAVTAPGYSYQYIDLRTDSLTAHEERAVGTIILDNQLALSLNGYDIETQQMVYKEKKTLSLGQIHSILIRQEGYSDTTLLINTKRPMVFTETELDIALRPLKSRHLIIVTNAQTDELVSDATLRLNGKTTAADTTLRIRQEIALQVSAPGYLFFDTLFYTGNAPVQNTLRVRLQPIEKGLVLQLRNIQFEYDSYELTESSNEALESLAQLLVINPTLRIELSAHTDNQGSDRYNERLSTLRGQAVKSWLVQHGIDNERIESKGYGKNKPLVDNDTEEHRAINRRVEIQVIDY